MSGTVQFITSLGIMFGTVWAWVGGLMELLGGAAMILGMLTRWTALAFALESLVIIMSTAATAATNMEFRAAALAGRLALGLIGPQRYVLDTMLPGLASLAGTEPAEPLRKPA